MNVSIAWTLPFVIIGLGVDDVYIVLMAIKKQGGYSKAHFLKAMKEVAVPVVCLCVSARVWCLWKKKTTRKILCSSHFVSLLPC